MDFWTRMASPGPATVVVNGVTLGVGSRVRLRPRARGDVLDLVLDGRIAIVEGIEQDDTGEFLLAVTLEDDPGRDLGEARMPGHRFFYRTDEVEPVLTGEGGTAFFDPHGEAQSERWGAFKQALDTLPLPQETQDAIVAAAIRTFDAIVDIMDCLAPPQLAAASS